jgi:flagellar basal-body rod protein FlgC
MGLSNVFNIAGSAMSAQAIRLNTVASNLANAESTTALAEETYKAKQVIFKTQSVGSALSLGVQVQRIVEDQAEPKIVHNPSHPHANSEGFVTLPNVNLTQQMVDMISSSRAYQNNVETMNAAKNMLLKTLTLGQS